MSKNSVKGYAMLGIVFVLVSVIAFAVPVEKTAAFWIAYTFTVVAFTAQIVIWKIGFGKDEMLKSKFFGFPLIYTGVGYFIAQIITFFVFLFIPVLPVWSAVLICAIIAGIAVLCMVSAHLGRGEIERIESNVQKKVFYIRELQADIELMAEEEKDAGIKISLAQLAEKIRYSDPVSSEKLAELERLISAKVAELKAASDKKAIITEVNLLIDKRNKKCRMQK